MKSFIQKMLVSTAIGIVSLASVGHAMAASPHHYRARVSAARAPYHYQAPLDVAAIPPYPNYSSQASPAPRYRSRYDIAARPPYPRWGSGYRGAQPFDVGRMVAALFGGAVSLHYSGRVTASDSYSYDYSSPPDTTAADVSAAAEQEQNVNDETDAAIQENNANLQALDQSIAASEAQNDAANAATQQYLINNGM